MTLLIIATRNVHKVREIQAVLGLDQFAFRTLNDFPGAPSAAEDAETFAGNATKKSTELAVWLAAHPALLLAATAEARAESIYCLADDSGLEVDALGGSPGVHSARFAALDTGAPGNSPDQANNTKLLRLLASVPVEARSARFRCVIALMPVIAEEAQSASPVCYARETEPRTELFEGSCEGRIHDTPRGQHGFGYDPLFVPDDSTQSFAELGDDVKNRISHRAKALQKLKAWFEQL